MSATVSAVTSGPPAAGPDPADDPRRDAAPSVARLLAVELRKAVDTRAGVWLLAATVLLSAALVVLRLCFGDRQGKTLVETDVLAQLPVNVLLPVIGILLVTSEWSQRTALTTFALVPHRGRVIGAKLVVTSLLAVAGTGVALLTAVAGFGIGTAAGATAGGWHLPAVSPWQILLAQVLTVLMGVAFGLVLLSSAPAIVVYFVLPTLWTVLGSVVPALRTPAEWLDTGRSMGRLLDPEALTGSEWAHVGASVALWVALPLAVGLWRLRRKEIA